MLLFILIFVITGINYLALSGYFPKVHIWTIFYIQNKQKHALRY